MRRIIFKNATAQKIYDDYFKRVKNSLHILSPSDQLEIMMDLNSHVYEAMYSALPENEIDILVDVLEKLGAPEVMLQPEIAYKKAQQATRSFNPKHVLQALYLNVFNGIGYVMMGLIYLFILAFGSLAIIKLIYPANTGFFTGEGNFIFGHTSRLTVGLTEHLGNWFIAAVLVLMVLFYFLNTLLFRLLKRT